MITVNAKTLREEHEIVAQDPNLAPLYLNQLLHRIQWAKEHPIPARYN